MAKHNDNERVAGIKFVTVFWVCVVVVIVAIALFACGPIGVPDPNPQPDHGAEAVGPPTDGLPYIKFRVAILPENPTVDQPYASRTIGGGCHSADKNGQPFLMKDLKTGEEKPFIWTKVGVTPPYEAWYGYISYPPNLFPNLQCNFTARLRVGDSMELEMSWPTGDRCPTSPGDVTFVLREEGQGSSLEEHPFIVHQLVQGI